MNEQEIRDAIVEKCYKDLFDAIGYAEAMDNSPDHRQALDTLKEYALKAQIDLGWIKVSDRMPESGKHVLFCCEIRPSKKRYVCDGYYAESKSITASWSSELETEYDEDQDEYFLPVGFYEVINNWDEYSSIVIEDFVTHWMPLPEPPKDGEE